MFAEIPEKAVPLAATMVVVLVGGGGLLYYLWSLTMGFPFYRREPPEEGRGDDGRPDQ